MIWLRKLEEEKEQDKEMAISFDWRRLICLLKERRKRRCDTK